MFSETVFDFSFHITQNFACSSNVKNLFSIKFQLATDKDSVATKPY